MPGALQTDELGYVLEVLAENKLIAARDDRHVPHPQGKEPFPSLRVVLNIDCDEIDAFLRKKLFRFEAAASPGLGEESELVGHSVHHALPCVAIVGNAVTFAATTQRHPNLARLSDKLARRPSFKDTVPPVA
jgi:hypothetical protein